MKSVDINTIIVFIEKVYIINLGYYIIIIILMKIKYPDYRKAQNIWDTLKHVEFHTN